MEAVSSRDRWILRITVSLCCLFLAVSLSTAQYFIPSLRYTILSVPLFPTSYDECSALDKEFDREVRELHTQHEQCLADAPREESSEGGTCSKTSCQALHTTRDDAGEKRSQEGRI
jgi:hypothetical protein